MITNLISMNGYGIYVTLSFGITTLACLIIYLKTLKTLKKYEREFSVELQKFSNEEKEAILKKSKVANQVMSSYNKTT